MMLCWSCNSENIRPRDTESKQHPPKRGALMCGDCRVTGSFVDFAGEPEAAALRESLDEAAEYLNSDKQDHERAGHNWRIDAGKLLTAFQAPGTRQSTEGSANR